VGFNVVLVFFVVGLVPCELEDFRVDGGDLPWELEVDFLGFTCANFVCMTKRSARKTRVGNETGLTIRAVLKTFDFDASVSAGVFGVFADVFPRQVGSETIYFCAVVSDKKDEVFSGEVASPASVG
jgi:hypothetical protein